jgi:hypothetical protein
MLCPLGAPEVFGHAPHIHATLLAISSHALSTESRADWAIRLHSAAWLRNSSEISMAASEMHQNQNAELST